MTTSSRTTSPPSLTAQLDLVEVKPGKRFSRAVLDALLPDVETALFFGKVYELDYGQLSRLLASVLHTDLAVALFSEGGTHSAQLQDYIVDICEVAGLDHGGVSYDIEPPDGAILPQVWESLEVEVASSIKEVASKLESVVGLMPGKQGQMIFSTLMKVNAKRPTIGDYRASVHHEREKQNLLILDVSGSMTEGTIRRIIDDVVALSYTSNAHMAVVSNTCSYWTPGSYSVEDVLDKCEYGGTQYEMLAPLFDRDWGTVITVADYDSSYSAKKHIADNCMGRIDLLLDVSLVNRPTFLAECVGQLADEVRPLLIASGSYVLSN
jgi:hypothetical protein